MKCASDFRQIARDALRGKWTLAVIAGLIASLLGVITSNGPKINFHFNGSDLDLGISYANQQIYSSQNGILPELMPLMVAGAIYILIAAVAIAVVFFVLGSVVTIGYSRFNLDLVDRRKAPEINTLFSYFSHWKTATIMNLLRSVYIFLWSLLFIIPGIVAGYSYAMTGYILAEHPEMTPDEVIDHSKQMMSGNRFRLFCLQLSFIGWTILAACTLGIGNLWLNPYKKASIAAFYREISGTEYGQNSGRYE
ncbi:MAG: DUF975 family protein [Faecousia sp.]